MKSIACFIAIKARGTVSSRNFVLDGHGGRQSSGPTSLSDGPRRFLSDKLRQIPALLPVVDTLVNSVNSGAPSTDIVGMLLISPSFSEMRLARENIDMEHRLWYELEGPVLQRVGFRVLHSSPFRHHVAAVPGVSVNDLKHSSFIVSPTTQQNLLQQVSAVLHAWRELGHRVETPNLAIQMPAAVAHLLAHRSLTTCELSVHRRFGAGTPFSEDFARLRTESHHSN